MGELGNGATRASAIKVREVASTAKAGQGNRIIDQKRGEVPVTLPDVCCSCLGAAERTTTFHREEGIAGGVALFLTGATALGAPVRLRFVDLDVPLCGACEARYRRRYIRSALAAVLPLLLFMVAMIVTGRGVFALACLGWMAGPMVALAIAYKVGAFAPGRMGPRTRPRFRNRAYQQEYDRLNATPAQVTAAEKVAG